jgi:uncharacterized protein
VKLLDLNLLLYAVNRDSPRHRSAKAWLEQVLSGEEPVALPWVVVLGFLRLTTHSRIFPAPLDPGRAVEIVDGWLARAVVQLLDPGNEHWPHVKRLLAETGTAGNLVTDAHLAALAIEHGCELCTTDTDFARFPGLRWVNPLA